MWTYEQRTGVLRHNGESLGTGYSGMDCPPDGMGKNNPMLQDVQDVGPIPQGNWSIGPVFDSEEFGPIVMRLTAKEGTDAFGRAGFLIHGDSIQHPGMASHGCIVLGRSLRILIAHSGDTELQVVG